MNKQTEEILNTPESLKTLNNTYTTPSSYSSKSQLISDVSSITSDYSFVNTSARIAIYDDFKSAPRVIKIKPGPTTEYIESLASKIYEQAKLAGGSIPYTVIREVSENFIHAQFLEIVVSILDKGNTIRFADQGPGIKQKNKAQLPGFTSATEPMKQFIRGVGSGLPIVKDYLDISHGKIIIEDNLDTGAVVTISLSQDNITGYAASSVYSLLSKLEEAALLEKTRGKKRILTDLGYSITQTF